MSQLYGRDDVIDATRYLEIWRGWEDHGFGVRNPECTPKTTNMPPFSTTGYHHHIAFGQRYRYRSTTV